jgi:chromosome segregation ATPase
LGNERTAKDMALTKERNSHQQAQNQRDALRQDLNRLLSEYRAKQSTVEQQIQEIDKLNVVINNLERDMLGLKAKYERAVEERNVTGVQLIDRNDELCILYERSNQQQEALRKGEIESIRKEEELRLVRLQAEELKRQYATARKRIPELDDHRTLINKLEQQLSDERRQTDELSSKLEDPQNSDRWRKLGGEDADMEQLSAKIQVLESRLDKKREQLLEKELVLEEVTSLTEKLRSQAVMKREAAKVLADQLNDLHNRIREVTKKMLASVSELSMYQVGLFNVHFGIVCDVFSGHCPAAAAGEDRSREVPGGGAMAV